jgi:hypothetical protein
MLIERICPLSGEVKQLDIAVTQDQFDAWRSGALIQNAMPNLSADEREFILTGITPDVWEELFGED